jgi:hypothetical protein
MKTETAVPQKQGGGKVKSNQKRSGGKSSILKGQERPSYDFCCKSGHTETACCIKARAIASDNKKETKDKNYQWKKEKTEKDQPFATAASASSKKEESSEDEDEDEFDKKAFMNSFI